VPWGFRTVPEELVACAEGSAEYYRTLGYAVAPEGHELGFPSTPTFRARRGNTSVVVEVLGRIDEQLLNRWTAYGKSNGRDFRVVVSVADSATLTPKNETLLRKLGVGCIEFSNGAIVERILPTDLALNVELPKLEDMPARVRELLGPAYEHFARGNWREGFGDACQAFEAEARRYMKRHSRTGRIKVLRKKGPTTLTAKAIDGMTMGQLARAFSEIVAQNRSDSVVAMTLTSVNPDRVGVTHKKMSKRVEGRLRQNVGRHMWALHTGFGEVIK
jgi:hypothetical protein